MQDLRVLFSVPSGTSYSARLADADDKELGVEVPFRPFLAEDDYEDLRWYLEEYMDLPDGGAIVRAERIETNLADWGIRLYRALFTATENRESVRLVRGARPRA